MGEYEKIHEWLNLYQAHVAARRGKRNSAEVIRFEIDLSNQISELSNAIQSKTYRLAPYYQFIIHDPKQRIIHALHYPDRIVQRCLCDQVLAPTIEPKLIYDNAACRIGKGTHFALKRLASFLSAHFRKYGAKGWALKCDIRKYFDTIDHEILLTQLRDIIDDTDVLDLLEMIIQSYELAPGKGLPLGNQSSQWFALYYLNPIDRLIKERFHIRHYTRYMDDLVLIHPNKDVLKRCLAEMRCVLSDELKLEFNAKTQIFPLQNGIDYLGFHFYLSTSGKVIRKVRNRTKRKFKRRLKQLSYEFGLGAAGYEDIRQVLASYRGHLSFGHCYRFLSHALKTFILKPDRQGEAPS